MSSCEKTHPINLGCHPYLTIGCIISCAICTLVMLWGVYAMRADMRHMESMMRTSVSGLETISEHCNTMPDMEDCKNQK